MIKGGVTWGPMERPADLGVSVPRVQIWNDSKNKVSGSEWTAKGLVDRMQLQVLASGSFS